MMRAFLSFMAMLQIVQSSGLPLQCLCHIQDDVTYNGSASYASHLWNALTGFNTTFFEVNVTFGTDLMTLLRLLTENGSSNAVNCSAILLSTTTCQKADMFLTLLQEARHSSLLAVSGQLCDNDVVVSTLAHGPTLMWMTVIVDLMAFLQWNDVILVVDGVLSEKIRQELVTHISRHQIGLITISLESNERHHLLSAVSAVKHSSIRVILVCSGADSVHTLFSFAEEAGLLFPSYRWLVVCPGPDVNGLHALIHNSNSNVAALLPLFSFMDSQFLDLTAECNNYNSTEESCLWPCHVFLTDRVAVFVPGHTNYQDFQRAISHLVASFQTCNFHAVAISLLRSSLQSVLNDSDYMCSDSQGSGCDKNYSSVKHSFVGYLLCSYNSQDSAFKSVGTWTPPSSLSVRHDVIFNNDFRDFKNATLRVGVWEAVPFLKRLSKNITSLTYEGFCMDILMEMALRLNFRYQLYEPSDGFFGAPNESGTWTGLVGMLLRKEIDIAIGPLTITSEREAVIDFTVPYLEDGGGILTYGGNREPDLLNIFRPFPINVWLILAAAVLGTSVALFFTTRPNNRLSVQQHAEDCEQLHLSDCMWIVIGSLMSQGPEHHPVSTSGRLVLGSWWIFTLLIVSIYTATLAAMLTVTVQVNPINSINDLAASSLTPVTITGTNWYTLFMTAQSAVFKEVGRRMAEGPVVRSDNEGVALVYKGGFAYIIDVNLISYMYSQDCRNLHMASTTFINNGLGFMLPPNAVYKEAINSIILKLHEGGFLEIWRKKWWKMATECHEHGASLSHMEKMGFTGIGGIIILYAVLTCIASVCLSMQLFVQSHPFRKVKTRFLSLINWLCAWGRKHQPNNLGGGVT